MTLAGSWILHAHHPAPAGLLAALDKTVCCLRFVCDSLEHRDTRLFAATTHAKTILIRKTFRQTRIIDKPDYSGYVANASQAIADLSYVAASSLLAAHRSQPAAR